MSVAPLAAVLLEFYYVAPLAANPREFGTIVRTGRKRRYFSSNEEFDADILTLNDQSSLSFDINENISSPVNESSVIDPSLFSAQILNNDVDDFEIIEGSGLNIDEPAVDQTIHQSFLNVPKQNLPYIDNLNTHIYHTSNLFSKRQIHIFKDINKKNLSGQTYRSLYFVVLINVTYMNMSVPTSICSLCNLADLNRYWNTNWEHLNGQFNTTRLFTCTHVDPMISKILHKTETDVDFTSPNLKVFITELFQTLLIERPQNFIPDTFLNLGNQIKGVRLYLTSDYTMIIVGFKRNRNTNEVSYFCYHCSRVGKCRHVNKLPAIVGIETERESIPLHEHEKDEMNTTERKFNILSRFSYPYNLDEDKSLMAILTKRLYNSTSNWLQEKQFYRNGTPIFENRRCTTCRNASIQYKVRDALLFSVNGFVHDVHFMSNWCETCECEIDFDGRSFGLLNVGNSKLFAIELILEMLEFKVNGGTPTYTYWKSKVDTYFMIFSKQKYEKAMSRRKKLLNMAGKVNRVIVQYLKMIDWPEKMFKCCEHPKVVCIDGTVLSILNRKIKAQNLKQPWHCRHPHLDKRFSDRRDRNIINISGDNLGVFKSFIREGITEQSMRLLKEQYQITGDDGSIIYHPVIQIMSSMHFGIFYKAPSVLKDFFRFFYKQISPAISLAPKALWPSLQNIVDTRKITENHIIFTKDLSPLLSKFLCHFGLLPTNTEITLSFIKHLLSVSRKTFYVGKPNYVNNIDYYDEPVEEHFTHLFNSGSFFPSRPPVRKITNILFGNRNEQTCNKDAKLPGKFGSGVLLYWCGEHRFCLGFSVLESAESLQEVYTTLIARFPILPKVIIYDNGCNLHEYFLNRSPNVLKETIILSDGFHWKNHINCAPTYDSKLYPFLDGLSSVLHEQKNAVLDKLKLSSCFMNYDSFCLILIYILQTLNTREEWTYRVTSEIPITGRF
ncbi:hypothetical protein BC833DRAFT_569508 [Globomyces pollinis-pini]|nr:hypothetical protein BC833DRAFT_569508 [Globomyces pollinis-pini]